MANQEQLDLLKQGVEAWNQWRREHRDVFFDLRGANLSGANLGGADLRRTVLGEADLSEADLIDADLGEAKLNWADLIEADLGGANLTSADFLDANLREAKLLGANLTRANFNRANLTRAKLRGADLSGANLKGADLSAALLAGATFDYARVGGTVFGNVDLSVVKGLETAVHEGPSTIGIDTIYCSRGNIPEIFLKGAGVQESFLTNMRALVESMSSIDFYSCFISYSSKDEDFAERLYADLQSKGVRCWFAPEDMKTGDEIRSRIDEAIRIHDKLLLVLSEHSVESSWVKKEVETAFEKEDQRKRLVLFPVRVDDTVMQTAKAWVLKPMYNWLMRLFGEILVI